MDDAPLGCLLEILSWPLDCDWTGLFDRERPEPPPLKDPPPPSHALDRPLVVASRAPTATGTCASCGASGGAFVRCAKCATRHHADCWRWLKRCAIYGCGSEKAD